MTGIGIHGFVWTGSSDQSALIGAMEKTAEAGFDLIEFPRLDPGNFDVPALARRLEGLGLKVAVSMGLPFSGDISSTDKDVVARGEAILLEAVSITRDLGATKLGGIIFSAHGKYNAQPTAEGHANSANTLRRVAEKAAAQNVTLNLEIVNRFETNLLNTTAQGLAMLDEIAMPNVFLHLDTFHMNIEEASPEQAIRLAGKRLGYIHIGESNRGYLGAGTVDFDRVFDALVAIGYGDFVTFESFSSEVVDKDLSLVAGIWRNTWTDNVTLARHARSFIAAKFDDARRRAETNARP